MSHEWAPIARIILRYPVGAGLLGSQTVGEHLAADPDIVFVVALVVGVVIEGAYAYAKRAGGAT